KVPADRIVDVGGVSTRYWVEGEGSPVVLIHGLSNSIEHWLMNFDVLAAEHTVYAADLLGHGRTDKPLSRSYGLADLARFVIDFMDTLGIERADLIGHSLGGGVALVIAEASPEHVRRLILVDSLGLGRDVGIVLRLVSVPLLGEVLTRLVLGGDFHKQLKRQRAIWPDALVVPEEMIRLRYEATRWNTIRRTYFKTLRASINVRGMRKAALQPIVEGLRSLHVPVLVVWGGQDDLVPPRQVRAVQEQVADARVDIFEDAGHDPMVVNPERFNRAAMEFLKDTSG
ncbi:MAG TPA: alpha/beta fold hydrolase, partial [Propionibacteriaceae bacterium]|nr:alpha/beta fold hydrolase [Propionibacteriaceae bacterium]